MARIFLRLGEALDARRGMLFPFVPVCVASGIGVFFSLRVEPPEWALILLATAGAIGLWARLRVGPVLAGLLCAISLVGIGVALAGARAHAVFAPVLDDRFYGPVQGRVISLDRSASDAVRMTLDRVWLAGLEPSETPHRVRVSLHGLATEAVLPAPGETVMTTAHLNPPGGAVEPGGFDFRRHAWFMRLGAVGYTRVPVVTWDAAQGGQRVFRARMALSARVQSALPGKAGAFAAAIMTGDRSPIGQEVLEDLRDANLAHLLAISGLHMGLLSGFVFAVLRLGLLLTPIGLTWPIKKIAACGALAAAAGYLALSGGNVATERAFIMVAVMLGAILCDQRALSLRAVALAALVVLTLRPEALLGPGFQMSFAATSALVGVFAAMRDMQVGRNWPGWVRAGASIVISSAVAGAATAPFAMAHFNQMAQFGLLANLASVPLMGVLVMPALVLATCLLPFGLESIGLGIAGLGLDWILTVAHSVAGWDGSVRPIPTPPWFVLPLIAFGGAICIAWSGVWRWTGLAPLAVATWFWANVERPAILVAEGGKLVGVMTEAGRALSRAKGSGFVADVWLENDGQGLSQDVAAGLWQDARFQSGFKLRHVHGKRGLAAFQGCTKDTLVIASVDMSASLPCTVLDATALDGLGSIAVAVTPDGAFTITSTRDVTGTRLWSP